MILLLETEAYRLRAEEEGTTYYLHFDYKLESFTKTIYMLLIEQWVLILKELKSMGITEIKSIIPKEEKKTKKFQLMFGLEEYDTTESFVLYRREL